MPTLLENSTTYWVHSSHCCCYNENLNEWSLAGCALLCGQRGERCQEPLVRLTHSDGCLHSSLIRLFKKWDVQNESALTDRWNRIPRVGILASVNAHSRFWARQCLMALIRRDRREVLAVFWWNNPYKTVRLWQNTEFSRRFCLFWLLIGRPVKHIWSAACFLNTWNLLKYFSRNLKVLLELLFCRVRYYFIAFLLFWDFGFQKNLALTGGVGSGQVCFCSDLPAKDLII